MARRGSQKHTMQINLHKLQLFLEQVCSCFSHGKSYLLDHHFSSMCDPDGDYLCVVCLSLSLYTNNLLTMIFQVCMSNYAKWICQHATVAVLHLCLMTNHILHQYVDYLCALLLVFCFSKPCDSSPYIVKHVSFDQIRLQHMVYSEDINLNSVTRCVCKLK